MSFLNCKALFLFNRSSVIGIAVVSATLMLVGTGCSDGGGIHSVGSTSGWSQARLPGVSRDAAFEVGLYAMGQWFRIAKSSPESNVVYSVVEEYDQRGGTGRLSEVIIEQKHRMRHTAMLKVEQEGNVCLVKCRVRVQRLDTASHRAFQQNRQFDDLPNKTPIDRGVGASQTQNQVWTDVRPDRQLERQILEVTRKRAMGEEDGADVVG